jgi:hypothetical protein
MFWNFLTRCEQSEREARMRRTVIAAILSCSAAFGQSTVAIAQQQSPTFEIASIKPDGQGEAAGFSFDFTPDGGVRGRNFELLIARQIVGHARTGCPLVVSEIIARRRLRRIVRIHTAADPAVAEIIIAVCLISGAPGFRERGQPVEPLPSINNRSPFAEPSSFRSSAQPTT